MGHLFCLVIANIKLAHEYYTTRIYASGSGEAMRWEYPICPEIEFSTLVVLRPDVRSSGPKAAEPQHAAQRRQTQTARLFARRAVEKQCAGSIPFVQKLNFQP